jgi:hypothetical protein
VVLALLKYINIAMLKKLVTLMVLFWLGATIIQTCAASFKEGLFLGFVQ